MKKLIAALAILVSVLCVLSSCRIENYDDGYAEGYDDGYFEGFDFGYYEGIAEAQSFIEFVVDDDLSALARNIESEYGLHPEDALQILSNYADVPDEVDETELNQAIWAIYSYYHKSQEIIDGIEDYSID